MPKRKLSEEQIDELCSLYQNGDSWASLRHHFGIADNQIINYLNLRGVTRRHNFSRGFKLSNETIDLICKRYESGQTYTSLLSEYNITAKTLSTYLKSRDVKLRGNWQLSETQMTALCEDYQNGLPWDNIITKYHTSVPGLVKTLQIRNVPYRGKTFAPQSRPKCDKNQKQTICAQYLSGDSIEQIVEDNDISVTTLYQYLRTEGVLPNRNANPDIDYFRRINTEHKAYWLGFIAADGCVLSKRNTLSISLSERDRDHLYRFLIDLNIDVAPRSYDHIGPQGQPLRASSIRVASKGLIIDLLRNGIVDRKTYCLEWPTPEQLSTHLIRHFARGYVDGDGCWYSNASTNSLHFECIGRTAFIEQLQKVIVRECDLNITKLGKSRNSSVTSTVRYGGDRQCARIANYLYKDAARYLPRKRDIVLNHYASHPRYHHLLEFS